MCPLARKPFLWPHIELNELVGAMEEVQFSSCAEKPSPKKVLALPSS